MLDDVAGGVLPQERGRPVFRCSWRCGFFVASCAAARGQIYDLQETGEELPLMPRGLSWGFIDSWETESRFH